MSFTKAMSEIVMLLAAWIVGGHLNVPMGRFIGVCLVGTRNNTWRQKHEEAGRLKE